MCGEFISPEALPLMQKWGIVPRANICRIALITSNTEWSMQLPLHAGSLSRYVLDEALAKRAQTMGAVIQTESKVKEIVFPKRPGEHFVVTLVSGEQWHSPSLFISAGRLVDTLLGREAPLKYIGVKAHFEGITLEELRMYSTQNAYFGVSPIDKNRVNVAGIMACSPSEIQSPRETFDTFLRSPGLKPLRQILDSGAIAFDDWFVGPVPEFGVRRQPNWPGVYFLGDAAGVTAPATGNGLAMAMISGVMAAQYALEGHDGLYRTMWRKEYARRIARGMLLHRLFLSPKLVEALPLITKIFPFLPEYCFNKTRGKLQ
jgi:flavin-dependent dehydrogenase